VSSPYLGQGKVTVAISPDGTLLASANDAPTVRLFASTGGKLLRTLPQCAPTTPLAFSPDGKLLATGGPGGAVKLWCPQTAQLLATLKGHKGAISALAFAPDGKSLASGSEDRTINLWEVGKLGGR